MTGLESNSALILAFVRLYLPQFFCFLISHLWKFDHFESLKQVYTLIERLRVILTNFVGLICRWRPGRQKGAFKRVMTFTYLLGLPCRHCRSV